MKKAGGEEDDEEEGLVEAEEGRDLFKGKGEGCNGFQRNSDDEGVRL